MIHGLTFKLKIALFVAASLLAVAVMAVVSVLDIRTNIIQARQDQLVTAVQSMHNVVMGYKARADSGAMPLEDAQKAAALAVGLSRYGGAEGKTEYSYIWSPGRGGGGDPPQPA